MTVDQNWLLEQSPDAYTVQLVTLSSVDRAERFLSAQDEPERFATYRLRREDRTLFVVVYGLFDDKSQADKDALVLPSTKGKRVSVDGKIANKLKPHQREGIEFIWKNCFGESKPR